MPSNTSDKRRILWHRSNLDRSNTWQRTLRIWKNQKTLAWILFESEDWIGKFWIYRFCALFECFCFYFETEPAQCEWIRGELRRICLREIRIYVEFVWEKSAFPKIHTIYNKRVTTGCSSRTLREYINLEPRNNPTQSIYSFPVPKKVRKCSSDFSGNWFSAPKLRTAPSCAVLGKNQNHPR